MRQAGVQAPLVFEKLVAQVLIARQEGGIQGSPFGCGLQQLMLTQCMGGCTWQALQQTLQSDDLQSNTPGSWTQTAYACCAQLVNGNYV